MLQLLSARYFKIFNIKYIILLSICSCPFLSLADASTENILVDIENKEKILLVEENVQPIEPFSDWGSDRNTLESTNHVTKSVIHQLFDDLNMIAKIYYNEILSPPLETSIIDLRLHDFQNYTRVAINQLEKYVLEWLSLDESKLFFYERWKSRIGNKKGKVRKSFTLCSTDSPYEHQNTYSLIREVGFKDKVADYPQILQLFNVCLQVYIDHQSQGESPYKILAHINSIMSFFDRSYSFNNKFLLEAIPSNFHSYCINEKRDFLLTFINQYFSKKISERMLLFQSSSYQCLFEKISKYHKNHKLHSIFTLYESLESMVDKEGQHFLPFDIPLNAIEGSIILEDLSCLSLNHKNIDNFQLEVDVANIVQGVGKPKKRSESCEDADDERDVSHRTQNTPFLNSRSLVKPHRSPIGFEIDEMEIYIKERVMGQDVAISSLCTLIHQHYTSLYVNQLMQKQKKYMSGLTTEMIPVRKSNILIMGDTGTGKTLTLETVENFIKHKKLDFAVSKFNAASLTRTGYTGPSVSNIFYELYEKSGKNLEKAQTALVFIDEIDKIFGVSQSTGRDIGGVSVQNELLAILQGCTLTLNVEGKKKSTDILFNTENILFICGGAFSMIPQSIKNIKDSDLFNAGFSREFIGRLHCRIRFDAITKDTIVKILKDSKESRFKQMQVLFSHGYGLKLTIEEGAIECIAEKLLFLKTGARAIQGFMDSLILREIPNPQQILSDEFLITKEMVGSFAEEYFACEEIF
ncbi:MAG: hypothetical protein C0432_00390 [Candidatus Puniceispirillum sp.]|nr:hypothetical protein [Candidatus Pelagibacter sp.]MBA4282741.1 hypothetical protein [Candidatus Puniceispirillum sp.]